MFLHYPGPPFLTVRFEDLPEPCRRSVVSDHRAPWGI